MAITVVSDFKGRALAGVGFEHVGAGLTQQRKVGKLNAVSRGGVILSQAGLSLEDDRTATGGPHGKGCGRRTQGGSLGCAGKVAQLIEHHGGTASKWICHRLRS